MGLEPDGVVDQATWTALMQTASKKVRSLRSKKPKDPP